MDTDTAWKLWSVRDPYYAVLAEPRFRATALTPETRAEFFASGVHHRDYVISTCRRVYDPSFTPRRVLDFGCGVGRIVIPFAQVADEVVGIDVAPAMLEEARKNCIEQGATNVRLEISDDALSAIGDGQFDLVHSSIVLQHLPVARGRVIFKQLVGLLKPGGCGMLHVTFGWDIYRNGFGQPPPALQPTWQSLLKRSIKHKLGLRQVDSVPQATPSSTDPQMDMHFYNLSELLFVLQNAGSGGVHAEFTDHGGAIGASLFFQR